MFLNQDAPAELEQGDPGSFWRHAIAHWDPARVPGVRAIPVT